MYNFDEYVSSISDTQITGEDPRADVSPTSTYYALKDLRNQLRAAERNALVDEEGISSVVREWKPLLEQCSVALIEESKDIEYLAWLIEALCRVEGFKGLTLGFKVACHLIEQHFESLYPTLEPGDETAEKLSALIGLNGVSSEGTLIIPLKSIQLTEGLHIEPYTFWEYQQSYDISCMSEEKREKKLANGALNFEEVEKAASESSVAFFVQLKDDIESAIEAFTKLSNAMDQVTGAPQPTSNIKKSLEQSLAAVNHIAGDKFKEIENIEEEQVDDNVEVSENDADVPVKSKLSAELSTREDAIKKLQEIAVFFRKTEPHSPMSYTIEQVVRWSELSLPELLNELITDNDARTGYFKLSGIQGNETET